MNKFVNHIRQKIKKIDHISDSDIEKVMQTTFAYLNEGGCYFCQNRNRLSIFSLCKVHHHIQPDCSCTEMDAGKFMKKNCQNILEDVNELSISSDYKRHIISESIKLYNGDIASEIF